MKSARTRLASVLLFSAALGTARVAATPVVRDGPVTATILTPAIYNHPGTPLEVGRRLLMDPGWHTYWMNPGSAGIATTVEWDLPEGFTAGPLRWPTPVQFREQGLTTYGYEGEVLLVAEVRPAADVAVALGTLSARVQWLACRVECVPGSATVSLGLPVRPRSPVVDRRVQAVFTVAAAKVPAADHRLVASAVAKDGQLILQVDGLGSLPNEVRFFPDRQGVIDISREPSAGFESGVLTLRLARAGQDGPPPARLRGALVLGAGEGARAIAVDVAVADDTAGGHAPARPAPAARSPAALLAALALAFLGGLLLNLMPCVLPVLSLKVLGLVRHARGGRRSAFAHGLVFSAGVLVSFWIIAGLLIALRAGGQLLGWGFQFQSPGIVTVAALLFFLVGLNLFGVFEVGAGAAAAGARLAGGEGWAASFLSGLLATAVATPCTAPFMGSALGYALTLTAPAALAVFTALGIGMAAPYLVLSAVPGLQQRLPQPGRWMETLKQVMGFPMMAAVVWMASVLVALSGPRALVFLLGAFVAAGAGAWAWGRWGGMDRETHTRIVAGIVAAGLVLAGAVVAVRASTAARPVAAAPVTTGPAAAPTQAGGAAQAVKDEWEEWSPARVDDLRAQGKAVFIDFSARWCLTCQVNERVALGNSQVRKAFRDKGVALLKADWTDRSGDIAAALAGYGRAGVPLYVLYAPGSFLPVLLPEVLTPGIVLSALEDLPAR